MANISKEVNIEMLEKLPDGTYKKKNPATKAELVKETARKKFVSDAEKAEIVKVKDKADKTYVDSELNKKSDETYVDLELSKKETPAGAQTKATKALTDSKVYTDSKVKTDVPAGALFTDTIVDISGKAEVTELTDLEQQLASLIGESVVSEAGHKEIRFWEEKLWYDNGVEWVEIKTGGGGGTKVGNVPFLSASAKLGNKIDILWKDPSDVVLEGVSLAKWKGTQVRRSISTYPIDEKDGELVVDSTVRDQYISGYTDTSLVSGQKYYYSLFPYTEDKVFTVDPANRVTETSFEKYDKEAPTAPTVTDIQLLKATVTSDVGSVVSLDKADWFASPHTFEGLVEGTTHTPYAKVEESADYYESPIATGTAFKAIAKKPQTAPSAPTASNGDFDRVTITGSAGTEVRKGTGAWFDSPYTFTGLTEETAYKFYARKKETTLLLPSPISAVRNFTTPAEQQIYGFEIDETNTNPKTAVTYIGDAVGMTPASGNNGTFKWGSWEPFIKEISKPVVVKAGVEQYDLNYDDYTKKTTGGASVLTGADGDVFTKITHIHMKHTKTSNGRKWELSDKPFAGSFSMTQELENGYNQFNNPILVTLQNLFILLFKDRDSQTALGRGRVDGAGYINSGTTDKKGFMFGSTVDLQIKFLGIEDFWGNKFQWVDGLVTDSSYDLLLGTKNFNDTGAGYTKQTTHITTSLEGYPKTVQGGKGGYVTADKDGSNSTSYPDYGHLAARRLPRFGGSRSDRSYAGAFTLLLNYAAYNSSALLSARLCFKSADAFFVGAYLGFEQGGKLRSISGNMPSDNKTIGAFRTLAKANN